jgi:hypothetical protein
MRSYRVPVKHILTKDDLVEFQSSSAYAQIFDFVRRLNDAAKDRAMPAQGAPVTQVITSPVLEIVWRFYCRQLY